MKLQSDGGGGMKLIFASDSFKGSLSSKRTSDLLTRAARKVFGVCECIGVPIADGGEGTVDALIDALKGEKVRSGLIKPVKLIFAQPETYVLYKELMLMKGYSIAQLKPVSVIDNDIQKGFFFTLTEDFEKIKKLSSH